MKRFTPHQLLRGGLLSAALLAGCQNHEHDAPTASTPAPASTVHSAPAPPVAAKPTPPRSKPDFGGVSSQHVQTTATGPTLQAAIDAALRLAIEQVNGKVVTAGLSSTFFIQVVAATCAFTMALIMREAVRLAEENQSLV